MTDVERAMCAQFALSVFNLRDIDRQPSEITAQFR